MDKKITNEVRQEIRDTNRSVKRITKDFTEFFKVSGKVIDAPVNLFYGLISGVGVGLLGLWFANINIIQSVFSSSSLSLFDKIDFLFTMAWSLLGKMDTLQVVLICVFCCFWLVVSAFWLEALHIQHERPKLRESFTPTLLVTLCIGAVGIISISLVTPVLTFQGVSVYVSQHFSGTILLIAAVIAELVVVRAFVKLIKRTFI